MKKIAIVAFVCTFCLGCSQIKTDKQNSPNNKSPSNSSSSIAAFNVAVPEANLNNDDILCDANVFSAPYYLAFNADLREAFGNIDYAKARTHWKNYGIAEGRRAHPSFFIQDYFAINSDVDTAADNYATAVLRNKYGLYHYVKAGMGENRGALIVQPNATVISHFSGSNINTHVYPQESSVAPAGVSSAKINHMGSIIMKKYSVIAPTTLQGMSNSATMGITNPLYAWGITRNLAPAITPRPWANDVAVMANDTEIGFRIDSKYAVTDGDSIYKTNHHIPTNVSENFPLSSDQRPWTLTGTQPSVTGGLRLSYERKIPIANLSNSAMNTQSGSCLTIAQVTVTNNVKSYRPIWFCINSYDVRGRAHFSGAGETISIDQQTNLPMIVTVSGTSGNYSTQCSGNYSNFDDSVHTEYHKFCSIITSANFYAAIKGINVFIGNKNTQITTANASLPAGTPATPLIATFSEDISKYRIGSWLLGHEVNNPYPLDVDNYRARVNIVFKNFKLEMLD